MYIDKQNCFTTDYNGVAFTATGQIGDVIDLGLGGNLRPEAQRVR